MGLVSKKIIMILAVSFVISGFFYVDCYAKKANSRGEAPLYKGCPMSFDFQGTVDFVDGKKVVVDDSAYLFGRGATFNAPGSHYKAPGNLKKGSRVGVIINQTGNVDSIWLLKNEKTR